VIARHFPQVALSRTSPSFSQGTRTAGFTLLAVSRWPLLHVSLSTIRRAHVFDAFVYQFGHHLSHRPLHTRSPRGNTVSDQRVRRWRRCYCSVAAVRQLVVARLSNRDAPRRRDQTVGISVFFTHVTNVYTSRRKRLTRSLFNTVSTPPNERRYETSPRQGPRSSARWMASTRMRLRFSPIRLRSARSEPKIYRSCVYPDTRVCRQFNCTAVYKRDTERALVHFLGDDMVFTRVVPRLLGRRDVSCTARRIHGFRTGWTKKKVR